jgi:hypothetical protein
LISSRSLVTVIPTPLLVFSPGLMIHTLFFVTGGLTPF